MSQTTDDLVADVRNLANLPDAGQYDAATILSFADAEMTSVLAALVKTARQEHWMTPTDTPCDGSRVVFSIPRRALDRAYRQVTLVDAKGVEIPCYEINAGEATWAKSQFHYYVQKSTLVFSGAPTAQMSVRIRSRTRPSKMVPTTSCAIVDHVTGTTIVKASGSVPAPAWLTGVLYVDIVNGDSPHDLGYYDLLTVSYSAPTLTLDATTPVVVADFVNLTTISNDRVDYICRRDETCYPPLPEAGFPVLVAATARRILEAMGDPRVSVTEATYQARLKACLSLISPQNEEGGRAIINRNSSLRAGGGGFWRRTRW